MDGFVDRVPFSKIVADEKKSFAYILSKMKIRCPSCQSQQYYMMNRKRIRCRRCRKDYNPLLGSKFSEINLPYSKWLRLIRLYEQSMPARPASVQSNVSYRTALGAFHIIQRTILEVMATKDKVLLDEIKMAYSGYNKNGTGGNRSPVFGILAGKRNVTIDIVQDITSDSLLNASVKKVRKGSIVYTDKWLGYDSLIFSGYRHSKLDDQKRRFASRVHLDSKAGFWRFAKERIRYHDVSPARFLCFIKEMEWRYNNRDDDLVKKIVGYMVGANQV